MSADGKISSNNGSKVSLHPSIQNPNSDDDLEVRTHLFDREGLKLQRSTSKLDHLRVAFRDEDVCNLRRSRSHDEIPFKAHSFIVEVESSLQALLDREDTNKNNQITIDDDGPKEITLRTVSSNGFCSANVRGTYAISNVLGILTLANEDKESYTTIDSNFLFENPAGRLSRLITEVFWDSLTRRLDESVIAIAAVDPKDWTGDPQPRIYIPPDSTDQIEYYRRAALKMPDLKLDVQVLPDIITENDYKAMRAKPGILALDMVDHGNDPVTGEKDLRGLPFIVPGGRFNELYNWDAYFNALGLLASGYTELVKDIVLNFVFEIQHYGLIPNANRSYYIMRSQPPFLTSLARKTYQMLGSDPNSREFLKRATLAAIKEYNQVWMAEPRYDPKTGMSRYRPRGAGIPMEVEPEHFAPLLEPYLQKYDMTQDQFTEAYTNGEVSEPELDDYFLHDRAVRESGHDVSLRMEGVCADLATIDLNSLLYKYERDIMHIIRTEFDDKLEVPAEFCAPGEKTRTETSAEWEQKAALRKKNINKYLWHENEGIYLDYNTKTEKPHTIESVTCFWPLWSGVTSPRKAKLLVSQSLPKFEMIGGLVSTARDSLPNGGVGLKCHSQHQWDFPYGWAPHQMMAWEGLMNYGFQAEAERLAYRWLYTVTKVFVDFNGAVVEKYDVTNGRDPHKVTAEYGNQGLNFKGYAREGFGWTNASFLYGLSIITPSMRRALEVVAPYEVYAKKSSSAPTKSRGD